MNLRISAVVLSCVLAAGCATAPGRSAAPAIAAVPAYDQRYAAARQKDAVEYEATARSVHVGARRALAPVVQWQQQAASAPGAAARAAAASHLADWNAMPMAERLGNDEGQPLVIILDADETALDNSPCQARRIDVDGFYEPESWSARVFDIAGTGPHVINVASPLPRITSLLTIDGSTQPGWVANTTRAAAS